MKTLQAILLVLAVALSVGCKKSEKKSTEPSTPTGETAPAASTGTETKPAETPPAETPPPAAGEGAGGAPTDTVCCDFDGQVGAATRSQCEGSKGKVLDKKPPC